MREKDELRIARLEESLQRLEDKLAIYQLLASYGPAVDSCSASATAAIWTEDGSYDFGEKTLVGAQNVGNLVGLDTHLDYVERGCAHVISMPMITIDGDCAVATGYSRLYVHAGDGWKVERISANRWELERTDMGWKVANRTNRLMNGAPDGRDLLARGSEINVSEGSLT